MATTSTVRALLAGTTLPGPLVDQLLAGASAPWLLGEPAEVLAADLALCHPPLAPGEVRASATATTDPAGWRVTIVANDRPGLLAATAGAMAFHGLTLTSASAASWPELGLALQCVTAADPDGVERFPADWDDLGKTLRAALAGTHPVEPEFIPVPPVRVETTPGEQGRSLVRIEAPDHLALLWAIAHYFESRGANIEATHMETDGRTAKGTLVVVGDVDANELAHALGDAHLFPWRITSTAVRLAVRGGLALSGVAAALVVRALRGGRRK